MSVLAPSFETHRLDPVGDWHPARCPVTLTGDPDEFHTEGDKLLRWAAKFWTVDGQALDLDEWQVWLLRRLLEVYPPWWPVEHLRGQLRYKEFVVSLARQNGKSVIGALLSAYWLTMHVRAPKIGLFASREEQAGIVYSRCWQAIENSPALRSVLRHTKTKGIHHRNGSGLLKTYPAKEASLQGEPFTGSLYDELHLGNMGLWDAIKIGQRAKPAAQLGGITTAGDDESLLLQRLYTEGDAAIEASEAVVAAALAIRDAGRIIEEEYERLLTGDERFGFFVWEAADDELTEANVIAANPAVACGRIPLVEVMNDSRKTWRAGPDEQGVTGRDRVIRYTLNRFLEGAASAWAPSAIFNRRQVPTPPDLDAGPVVFGIDRTDSWANVAIYATVRYADGLSFTEPVATLVGATNELLIEVCTHLAGLRAATFAMPSDTMKALGTSLKDRGVETWILGTTEMQAATAAAKAAVLHDTWHHDGDPLLRQQSSRAKTRETEDGERISRTLSVGDVDAIRAAIAGYFVAQQTAGMGMQLF